MKNKKQSALIIGLLLLSIFLSIGGVYNIIKGFNNFKLLDFSYQEDNSVHYKVYLKKNDFFENEYLEEDKTYITSLIDHLNVDFKYLINFSDKVSGSYEYSINAIITADKKGEKGNYWTKEFIIQAPKTISVKNEDSYLIQERLDIDYNRYNDLLNEFKEVTRVSTDATLTIKMEINNDVKSNATPVEFDSELSLSIPLSQLTVEGKASTEQGNSSETIVKKVRDEDPKYFFCKVVGIGAIISSITLLISAYQLRRRIVLSDIYNHKLNKILTTYDGIIVNVKKIPDLKYLNKIEVTSFEELIDAHSEVRMPINFYEDKRWKKSTFVLINGSQAYVYCLNFREAANEEKD